MGDVRQVLPGHAEPVRKVVIPGGNNYLLGRELRRASLLVATLYEESAVTPFNPLDTLTQPHVQRVVLRALAVILKRLGASGLFCGAGERQIADFEQFLSGKNTMFTG